jgi:hypothetical protein
MRVAWSYETCREREDVIHFAHSREDGHGVSFRDLSYLMFSKSFGREVLEPN